MGRVPSETGIDSDRGAWCADAHADAALPQCRSLYSPKREAKARDTGRVRNRDQGAIDMWPAREPCLCPCLWPWPSPCLCRCPRGRRVPSSAEDSP